LAGRGAHPPRCCLIDRASGAGVKIQWMADLIGIPGAWSWAAGRHKAWWKWSERAGWR